MPFRAWLLIVVLGLSIMPDLGHTQEGLDAVLEDEPVTAQRQEESTTASDDNSTQHQPPAIDPTPALESIEAAIRDLIAEEDKIERERHQDRERRDLDAQVGMALWAKRMFFATLATVVLTFIALFAIIKTPKHTRRAADSAMIMAVETGRATKAARAAVAVTREIGEIQTRAYVGVARCKFILECYEAEILSEFTNTGNTPATGLRIVSSLSHESGAERRYILAQANIGSGPPPGSVVVLGSGGTAKPSAEKTLTDEEIKEFESGRARMVFTGTLTYTDVFERKWAQDFQWAIGKDYGGFTRDGPMMISKFNGPEREITNE